MASLFLHIGLAKSGSTSLQFHLSENVERLVRRGILYPDFRGADTGAYKSDHVNHRRFFDALHFCYAGFAQSTQFNAKGQLRQMCRDLISEADRSDCNKVLISSEGIWTFSAAQIQEIKKFLDDFFDRVVIITFLRRQDFLIESFYNHRTREGFYIEPFIKCVHNALSSGVIHNDFANIICYEQKIVELINIFGLDQIKVHCIRESDASEKILHVLENFLFEEEKTPRSQDYVPLEYNKAQRNRAIPTEYAEIIRLICSRLSFEEDRVGFARFAQQESIVSEIDFMDPRSYTLCSDELRLSIQEKFKNGNQIIEKLFCDSPGSILNQQNVDMPEFYNGVEDYKLNMYVNYFRDKGLRLD